MTDTPDHEHDDDRIELVERAERISDRTKAVLGAAVVLGISALIVMQIIGFFDRAATRAEDRRTSEYVTEAVHYFASSDARRECIDAKNDDYRFAEQRYLEAWANDVPHDNEPPIDVLRKDWLDKFFAASGARDPALKRGCGPLPLPPKR